MNIRRELVTLWRYCRLPAAFRDTIRAAVRSYDRFPAPQGDETIQGTFYTEAHGFGFGVVAPVRDGVPSWRDGVNTTTTSASVPLHTFTWDAAA